MQAKKKFVVDFDGTEAVFAVEAYSPTHARSLAIIALEEAGLYFSVKSIRQVE